MHLSTFEYKGLVSGGFEGSVRYKNDQSYVPMYTQEEASQMLANFPSSRCHALSLPSIWY